MSKCVCFAALSILLSLPLVVEAKEVPATDKVLEVRYPSNILGGYNPGWDQYFVALLELALDKSGREYQLGPVAITGLTQGRSIRLLQQGHYDIHWFATDTGREEMLLPIRIPLYKGLIGWRIGFVHKDLQAAFKQVNSAIELARFNLGQGRDWPDTEILQANKLKVLQGSNAMTLMQMLSRKRIDLFPRSVLEILPEAEQNADDSIMIEQSLLLHYPLATFFFVSRENVELQQAIEKGLNNAISDGSFEGVFTAHFADTLEQLELWDRTIIRLKNPNMSEATLNIDDELWFQPKMPP